MNPFARTAAGLFIVLGPKSKSPLLAEQICAALIDKLKQAPSCLLNAQTWKDTVQMVPDQVSTVTHSKSLEQSETLNDLPNDLACLLAGEQTDLVAPIKRYLDAYGAPTAVNCLILNQSKPGVISVDLGTLTVKDSSEQDHGEAAFTVAQSFSSALINIAKDETKRALTSIFGDYASPDRAPYYLRITT